MNFAVHSAVDLITNSSSTVYTMAKDGAIDSIKKMVNAILRAGQSSATFDDLFEAGYAHDSTFYEEVMYKLPSYRYTRSDTAEGLEEYVLECTDDIVRRLFFGDESKREGARTLAELMPSITSLTYPANHSLLSDELDKLGFDAKRFVEYYDLNASRIIKVVPRDPANEDAAKIMSSLENLFDTESVYDG